MLGETGADPDDFGLSGEWEHNDEFVDEIPMVLNSFERDSYTLDIVDYQGESPPDTNKLFEDDVNQVMVTLQKIEDLDREDHIEQVLTNEDDVKGEIVDLVEKHEIK